jgi:hypothetical protein
VSTADSFCCDFWQVQGISTCARERGTSERSKRVSGILHCTEIGVDLLLPCGAPVKNFDGLAAQSGEGERGKRRGEGGLLIAVV